MPGSAIISCQCDTQPERLVKSPKVYIRDSGLLHTLLGIGERRQLEGHPVVGGSWEGFVIEQLLAHLPKANAYYWRTQAGAELDLLLFLKGRRVGVEIKRADAPKMTPSMVSALKDLELHPLLVVYPGSTRFSGSGPRSRDVMGCGPRASHRLA